MARKSRFFTVDARALLTLGRDSIKEHTTAVVELVKNSYDADATVVEVELKADSRTPRKLVRIADDGHGMDSSTIDESWLRIGFSNKLTDTHTKSNRRRTGEKGIGRLSSDRLGRVLELRSKSSNNESVGLKIDWSDFEESGKDLGKVPIETLEDSEPAIPKKAVQNNHGTELVITKLRQRWTRADVQALYDELSLLTPPFKDIKRDFHIYFRNDIDAELNGSVQSQLLERAEIELHAKFDGSKFVEISLTDRERARSGKAPEESRIPWNKLVQSASEKDDPQGEPVVGAFSLRLLFFPRKSDLLDGTKFSLADLRTFLDANSGVKIYRDDIRVKPYGDPRSPDGDWLGLAERKTRSPAGPGREDFVISANQLVGAVFVTRDGNPKLKDSSSREGLVRNEALMDLRRIVVGCLLLLESHYHKLFTTKQESNPKVQRVRESVRNLKVNLRSLSQDLDKLRVELPRNASSNVDESIGRIDSLIQEIGSTESVISEIASQTTVFRALSTLGIASAVFGHETQTWIVSSTSSIKTAHRLLSKATPDIESAISELETARKYADNVASWGHFALQRIRRDKRRRRRVSIRDVIDNVLTELKPALEASNVDLAIAADDIQARVFPMDIESVAVNLVTNAYAACLQTSRKRRIKVFLRDRAKKGKPGFQLSVVDSGPGIAKKHLDRIWEPLFSTKVDKAGHSIGTGLGLTIVRSVVDDVAGTVDVDRNSPLGGARFSVWFPNS
jgi:signal transduction histidine kinase